MPEPFMSQVAVRPDTPSVTAYMALRRSLRNPKRSRYAATGCLHRSRNTCHPAHPALLCPANLTDTHSGERQVCLPDNAGLYWDIWRTACLPGCIVISHLAPSYVRVARKHTAAHMSSKQISRIYCQDLGTLERKIWSLDSKHEEPILWLSGRCYAKGAFCV